MNRLFRASLTAVATCALFGLLAGCPSTHESSFYLLSPVAEQVAAAGDAGPAVRVNVTIAEYLRRPEIVLRVSPNQYYMAEYDRWAEPIEDNLTRVLVDNLTALLGNSRVEAADWPGQTDDGFRVDVAVGQLDGAIGDAATLQARWRIVGADGSELVATRTSRLTESTQGNNYEALVAAQSRALGKLSQEIAAALAGAAR